MNVSTFCIILLCGAPLLAQDSSSTPTAPAQVGSDSGAGRILGVIPDNKIVPSSNKGGEPLTVGGKFNIALKDTTDPFTFVLAGFYAGVSQWNNDYRSWGQGASGYGQRIGAAYADQVIGNYFTEAIIPSITHQDPRYFRKGTGKKWARMSYALTRTMVTRTDRGRSQFNYSEWAGNGIAVGISNLYYPPANRTLDDAMEKLGVQIVSDSAFNVLLEFWPDMKRAVLHRR